eukprot:181594_1
MAKEEQKVEEWLQFFDNGYNDSTENEDIKMEDKTFNTNNVQGVKYNPYKFTLTNDASDKDTMKLYSIKELQLMIRDYNKQYNAKLCFVCGQHFKSYTDREIHSSQNLFRTDKACSPVFNAKKYDTSMMGDAFAHWIVYIHLPKKRLDTIQGLRSLLTEKLKGQIELLPSNIFSHDSVTFVCFAVPLFCFETVHKHLYFAEITNYDLEVWYEALCQKNRDYTPYSKYIKLESDELDALQKLYQSHRFQSSLKPEVNNVLSRLTRKWNRCINQFTEELAHDDQFNHEVFLADEYFVKLSTRSPKDGTGVNPKTYPNTSRVERILLMMNKMKIKQSAQITELIQRSARVHDDIGFYHRYTIAFTHPLNLILRSFFKRLNPMFEFRCFIKDKRLNAISQYLCYDVFEELHDVALLRTLRDKIVSFHKEVKDVLPYLDCVMDVFVDIESMNVYIVEINPFGAGSSSGSALFEWKTDYDLLYGNAQNKEMLPVFRVAKRKLQVKL